MVVGSYKLVMARNRLLFGIFALPMIALIVPALVLVVSPVWFRLKRLRTVYAVTNLRVIVQEGNGFGGCRTKSFWPDTLALICVERTHGVGDLLFVQRETAGNRIATVGSGFFAVEKVRDVENVIRATLSVGRTRTM
jgi:hypothetical protein